MRFIRRHCWGLEGAGEAGSRRTTQDRHQKPMHDRCFFGVMLSPVPGRTTVVLTGSYVSFIGITTLWRRSVLGCVMICFLAYCTVFLVPLKCTSRNPRLRPAPEYKESQLHNQLLIYLRLDLQIRIGFDSAICPEFEPYTRVNPREPSGSGPSRI